MLKHLKKLNNLLIMKKEIVILLAVFGSLFLFVPFLLIPFNVAPLLFVMGPFPFMCLIVFSAFHIKNLFSKSPKKAIIFLALLLTVILIASILIWWQLTHPLIA